MCLLLGGLDFGPKDAEVRRPGEIRIVHGNHADNRILGIAGPA
jgi:hypothetical protein